MKPTLRTWLLGVVLAGFALAASAQEMHARVSGTWQQIDEIHARVSGTWQQVQEGWVRVSGTWQQFYTLGQQFDLTYGAGGLNTGYLEVSYGSLSPDFLDSGIFGAAYTIRMLVTNSGGNLLAIEMSGTSRPQSVFSTITTSVGTYESASATYYANYLSSGNTRWEWSVGSMFPSSGSETVVLAP